MKIRHVIEGGMAVAGIAGAVFGAKMYVDQQAINQKLNDEVGRLGALVEAGNSIDRITIKNLCMTQQASGFIDPAIDCVALADMVINRARGEVVPIKPLAPVQTPHFERID